MKAILALFALVAASTLDDWLYGLWHGPVHLTCQGKNVFSDNYQESQKTLHVEIDYRKGTVKVEDFVGLFTIMPAEHAGSVSFELLGAKDHSGIIDRYTGVIVVISGRIWDRQSFNGTCHQAGPLF